MGSKFNCQRCGACCRLAGCSDLPEIKAMADEGTDVCRHLLPNNLCAIYETRPWFCRVDETYERIIKEQGISLEEWHEKITQAVKCYGDYWVYINEKSRMRSPAFLY